MEEFRSLYLRLCKENSIDPQDSILARLEKQTLDNGVLDLSNHTLELSTCAVLSKLFAYDLPVIAIILSDCMLSEECTKQLLSGLAKNTVVKELDLRGNNLRRMGAEALGNFLKNNHTIESLALEWNALGIWEVSFAAFCDGLAANTSLQKLDLRNNQIDHAAAQELALAIRNNSTLRKLDLGWNNAGLVGGRALADALQKNRSVNEIRITGNNIPKDIVSAIETSTLCNDDRAQLTTSTLNKTKTLNQEIEFLKSEKKKQMINFMDDIEMTRSQLDATNKDSANKISHLQQALEERKAALNALRAKLDMCEASLTISNQKSADQNALLELCRKDNQELVKSYDTQISREREDHKKEKELLQQSLEQTQDNLSAAEGKIIDLERKCKFQNDQILLLKETITQAKSEHRIALAAADERLATERRRLHMELKEMEDINNQEKMKLHSDMASSLKQADDKVERTKLSKDTLENEIAELKAKFAQERLDHDDSIRLLRKQLKDEEKFQTDQLQEKMRSMTSDKADLQKRVSNLSLELSETQANKTASDAQLEGMRRTIDGLQKVLSNKDDETDDKIAKVKKDFEKRITYFEEETSKMGNLREKVVCLETRLAEQAAANRETIGEREKTIERLSGIIRTMESNAAIAREDEAKRAALLQSAICSYLQGVKSGPPSSPIKL
uniref:Leucine-rich repeat-containing protein 45-like n=1 Tax=Phallusia mammillata TaxID=59560 RepID=A0A6F9DKF9_9ASCI|nr:leucine-rich repeat-containing protein 45-like [Phallusia mammillata]